MGKKDKNISEDLINISMSSSNKSKELHNPANNNYEIHLESDGYYKITLDGETIIHTKVSDRLLGDLKLWKILPENGTDAEIKMCLEAYLIRAAKEFVNSNLHKKKQDERGKIDTPGFDEEF